MHYDTREHLFSQVRVLIKRKLRPDVGISPSQYTNVHSQWCRASAWLFLERPRKDIGIDAHIELVNEIGEPTGALAFIQSKGGLSYTKTGRYQIKADKKHFETWSRYTIPVIGIVYNPILCNAPMDSLRLLLFSSSVAYRRRAYHRG